MCVPVGRAERDETTVLRNLFWLERKAGGEASIQSSILKITRAGADRDVIGVIPAE